MKTDKMSQETIAALHKSIAHWNDICYGDDDRTGMRNCAMCQLFYLNEGHCRNCPVPDDCERLNSVYARYMNATPILADNFCTVDSAEAAEAMLELLVSLLPKRDQDRYFTDGWEVCHSNEWSSEYGDYASEAVKRNNYRPHQDACFIWSNITPDGRNAFPQAKYVWEKVFDNQVCGPIPEMPEFKQVPMTATAIKTMWEEYDREARRRDTLVHMPYFNWINYSRPLGPMPVFAPYTQAIGRTVRVTKYKVAFINEFGCVTDSGKWYKDEAEWKRSDITYEFVGLIKSTAKEFDV